MKPRNIPYKLLAKKISSVLTEEMQKKRLNIHDLVQRISLSWDVADTTIYAIIHDLQRGYAYNIPGYGNHQEKSFNTRIQRLSSILEGLEIQEDHDIIKEMRQLYGNRFVYPPKQDNLAREPRNWVI